MTEQRCHTRVVTTFGTAYMVVEDVDTILAQMRDTEGLVDLTSMTGQDLFPPERLVIRADKIALVQALTEVSWLWNKRASQLHYARQLQDLEANPHERVAQAQERLAAALGHRFEDEDE